MPRVGDASLERTSRFAGLKLYRSGSTLMREERRAETLYILISGTLVVSQKGRTLLKISEPGSYVGEIYVLLDKPSAVTVEAETDVTAIPLKRDRLEAFFQEVPDQALKLARILSRRILETLGEVQRLRGEVDRTENLGTDIYETFRQFHRGGTREQLNQKLEYWVSEVKRLGLLKDELAS